METCGELGRRAASLATRAINALRFGRQPRRQRRSPPPRSWLAHATWRPPSSTGGPAGRRGRGFADATSCPPSSPPAQLPSRPNGHLRRHQRRLRSVAVFDTNPSKPQLPEPARGALPARRTQSQRPLMVCTRSLPQHLRSNLEALKAVANQPNMKQGSRHESMCWRPTPQPAATR